MNYVYARFVALMEFDGGFVDASEFVLSLFRGGDEPVKVFHHHVTQWVDPVANEVVKTAGGRNKYTVDTAIGFHLEGGYKEAQEFILKRLYSDEAATHMNVQVVDISLTEDLPQE
jgi:hypothetical protein